MMPNPRYAFLQRELQIAVMTSSVQFVGALSDPDSGGGFLKGFLAIGTSLTVLNRSPKLSCKVRSEPSGEEPSTESNGRGLGVTMVLVIATAPGEKRQVRHAEVHGWHALEGLDQGRCRARGRVRRP